MESEKNLEEGEIASRRRERRMHGTRARTYHHPSHYRAGPSRPTPLSTPSLSAAYYFFAFHRLLSSLESFHPPEIEKNLGGPTALLSVFLSICLYDCLSVCCHRPFVGSSSCSMRLTRLLSLLSACCLLLPIGMPQATPRRAASSMRRIAHIVPRRQPN